MLKWCPQARPEALGKALEWQWFDVIRDLLWSRMSPGGQWKESVWSPFKSVSRFYQRISTSSFLFASLSAIQLCSDSGQKRVLSQIDNSNYSSVSLAISFSSSSILLQLLYLCVGILCLPPPSRTGQCVSQLCVALQRRIHVKDV